MATVSAVTSTQELSQGLHHPTQNPPRLLEKSELLMNPGGLSLESRGALALWGLFELCHNELFFSMCNLCAVG